MSRATTQMCCILELKGPYSLSDNDVIVYRIDLRRPILLPILSPCGYGLFIGRLGNWSPGDGGHRETADLYQACLIFHWRPIARQRPAPSDQSLGNRGTKWVWPLRVTRNPHPSFFKTLERPLIYVCMHAHTTYSH